jgi:hypothetical protein
MTSMWIAKLGELPRLLEILLVVLCPLLVFSMRKFFYKDGTARGKALGEGCYSEQIQIVFLA